MDQIAEVIETAWGQLIEFTTQFVVPDWGYLVSLIPLVVLALVALVFGWIGYRYATAGPTRRGPRRIDPLPPASLHMPGPSFAPIFGALGAALLFFGLVFGGVMLWLGLVALVIALLYWGREALRDYDQLEAADAAGHGEGAPALAAGEPVAGMLEAHAAGAAAPAGGYLPVPAPDSEAAGPPAGVHIPGPSWRPIIVSIALAILFVGLVTGGPLLVAGLLAVFIALGGWLFDAGREYRATERADETGHLETEAAPRAPTGTLIAFAVLVVGAMAVNFVMNGALLGSGPPPTGDGGSGGAPGETAAPGASAAPGESPAASEAPIPEADITITAQNIAYLESEVTAPADTPFTIAFVNLDAGVPHNVAIHEGSPTGPELWQGEIFNGVETRVYEVPALPAGTYGFICTVHPNMTGTLIVR
jgi:plastocyanin